MPETLTVEFHCHTRASQDCLTRPEALLAACRAGGIDRVAITDHNTLAGALAAQALEPGRVIVGEEIMTTRGELLAFFVRDEIPAGLEPEEAIRRLRAQAAFISVSHPFDRFRKGGWAETDLLKILPLVDAIEVFNARCLPRRFNAEAAAFAAEHGVAGTAGSDAHSRREVGRAAMRLPAFGDAEGLRQSLKQASFTPRHSGPGVRLISRYASLARRLGLAAGPRESLRR
ncbi:MAG: hypothetical protein HYZ26_00270 [Chloroflexi bacterium]|nr:hypothetical protein [Chloroflexota bacterium]